MSGSTVGAALRIRDLDVSLGGRQVLHAAGLDAEPGQVVGLLGPNGSGKSTLLRAASGLLAPTAGSVRLADLDVRTARRRDVARACSVVAQDQPADLELSVLDVVLLGRLPHGRGAGDLALAEASLRRVGTVHLAGRAFPSLSGGERQRVLVARALCQEPGVLLLDEPTNHLDVAHQLELLALLGELDTTCVVALHDLSLAAAHCDHLVLLEAGRVVAAGPPSDVLDPARVSDVYGVACDVIDHPRTGRPLVAVSRATPTPHPEGTS